jgi:hypothetical protein
LYGHLVYFSVLVCFAKKKSGNPAIQLFLVREINDPRFFIRTFCKVSALTAWWLNKRKKTTLAKQVHLPQTRDLLIIRALTHTYLERQRPLKLHKRLGAG